eukprot:COSAG02_NODE_4224_length_5613_cov_38.092087_2_plen_119_part_00
MEHAAVSQQFANEAAVQVLAAFSVSYESHAAVSRARESMNGCAQVPARSQLAAVALAGSSSINEERLIARVGQVRQLMSDGDGVRVNRPATSRSRVCVGVYAPAHYATRSSIAHSQIQ